MEVGRVLGKDQRNGQALNHGGFSKLGSRTWILSEVLW